MVLDWVRGNEGARLAAKRAVKAIWLWLSLLGLVLLGGGVLGLSDMVNECVVAVEWPVVGWGLILGRSLLCFCGFCDDRRCV